MAAFLHIIFKNYNTKLQVKKMKIIQCAYDCIYQKDGYCELEVISVINSIKTKCPHYKTKLNNKIKNIAKISYTDNFNF